MQSNVQMYIMLKGNNNEYVEHWLSTIDVSFKSNKLLKSYAILAKLIYECFAGTVFVVMARDGCAFVAAVGFLNEM